MGCKVCKFGHFVQCIMQVIRVHAWRAMIVFYFHLGNSVALIVRHVTVRIETDLKRQSWLVNFLVVLFARSIARSRCGPIIVWNPTRPRIIFLSMREAGLMSRHPLADFLEQITLGLQVSPLCNQDTGLYYHPETLVELLILYLFCLKHLPVGSLLLKMIQ